MAQSTIRFKKRRIRKWLRLVLTSHLFERLEERLGRGAPELWQLRGVPVELIRNGRGWELLLPGLGLLAGTVEGGAFIACTYKYPRFRRCRRHRQTVWIEDVVLNQTGYYAASG